MQNTCVRYNYIKRILFLDVSEWSIRVGYNYNYIWRETEKWVSKEGGEDNLIL